MKQFINEDKFRAFVLKSGRLVLCGRNEQNNEKLIAQAERHETLLHTVNPGSPFCNIKGEATLEDVREGSIICAKYSQSWKKKKDDVGVHVFRASDVFKEKSMKIGTFGVNKFSEVKVKKADILALEERLGNEIG